MLYRLLTATAIVATLTSAPGLAQGAGSIAEASYPPGAYPPGSYPPGSYDVTAAEPKCAYLGPGDARGPEGELAGATVEVTLTAPKDGVPIKVTKSESDTVVYEGETTGPTTMLTLGNADERSSLGLYEIFVADQKFPVGVACPVKSGPGSGSGGGSGNGSGLPNTGTGLGIASIAVSLVAAGAALTSVSRRRRTTT